MPYLPSPPSRKKFKNLISKAKKSNKWKTAKNIATQTAVDAAIGYGVGGKLGAITGGLQGAYTGYMKKIPKGEKIMRNLVGRHGKKYKKRDFKKSVKRTTNSDGSMTKLGFAVKGIHSSEELRYSTVPATNKLEAVRVGHTTMPSRPTLFAVCRALTKLLFNRQQILDFTDNAYASPYAYAPGDNVRFTYYLDWTTNTLTQKEYTFPAVLSHTWDDVAASFYQFFNDELRTTGVYMERIRFQNLIYVPLGPSTSYHEPVSVNMNRIKIHMILESVLKVQNRTVTNVTQDESVDVTNVPLSGKIYHCKGNNLFDRSLRKIMTSPALGTQATVDMFLYEGIEAQAAIFPGVLNGAAIPTNAAQSSFAKPAEPPQAYQFLNCKSAAKVVIEPGEIQESKLRQTFALPLKSLINILTSDYATLNPIMTFNPRKGICRVIHLEKTIGSLGSDVAVRTEVQWDCWCAATKSKENNYTNDISIQVDINTGVAPT